MVYIFPMPDLSPHRALPRRQAAIHRFRRLRQRVEPDAILGLLPSRERGLNVIAGLRRALTPNPREPLLYGADHVE